MRTAILSSLITILILTAACRQEIDETTSNLYTEVWVGEAGSDIFAFQFIDADLEEPGVIHCLRDGRKYSELPITTIFWDPPYIEIFMEATGVTYSGELVGNTMVGEISSGGEFLSSMDLVWTPSVDLEGLPALTEEYSYSQPDFLDDDLSTGYCTDHRIPEEAIEELVSAIASGEAGLIHSLLIISDGELIVEEYFHGYTESDPHRLLSVTKSISSILTGIALDQHSIDSVTVPLSVFFPEADSALNLKHLLTMSMGLDWSDDEAENYHGSGKGFFTEILSKEVVSEPGASFRYVNPDVNLLSGILKQSTGYYPDEFAEEFLFLPLGIDTYEWSYGECDGHRLMDGSLQLRPRDMAKIGLLMLDNGVWRGERILSEEWISESTTEFLTADENLSYGYLWWLGSIPHGEDDSKVILANGWGSQFIMVIPDAGIVITTTGGNEDNGKHWQIIPLLKEILIRASF